MDRLSYSDIARIFGTGLISTGIGLLLFVGVTILWGDPFTKIGESSAQSKLAQQYAQFGGGTQLKTAKINADLTRLPALRYRKSLKQGQAVGKMTIPRLGFSKVIVNGTSVPDLKKGPGVYPEAGFPGMGVPIGVAGHRTTYGAPFLDIDQLKNGDKIIVEVPYGRFTYTVSRERIIKPTDWSIIKVGQADPRDAMRKQISSTGRCPTTCEFIVLTACHPKYSAAERIAVFARLSEVELRAGGKNAT